MDEERRIRFLVAPLLFVASLMLALWSNDSLTNLIYRLSSVAEGGESEGLNLLGAVAGVIAGGGVIVFAAGYVIGGFTYVALRAFFFLRWRLCGGLSQTHEVALPEDAFKRLWKRIRASGSPSRDAELYAGVVFDHGVLKENHEGVHRWLVRRWSAFSVAATTCAGLFLSLFVAPCFMDVPLGRTTMKWWLPVVLFAFLLIPMMRWSWKDTMGMLSFMTTLPADKKAGPNTLSTMPVAKASLP